MRFIDNGSFYTVMLSARDVETFKRSYPCSGVPTRPIAFQFDKRNGDLVDITPDSAAFDGSGLSALAQDAQTYGERRLGGRC